MDSKDIVILLDTAVGFPIDPARPPTHKNALQPTAPAVDPSMTRGRRLARPSSVFVQYGRISMWSREAHMA